MSLAPATDVAVGLGMHWLEGLNSAAWARIGWFMQARNSPSLATPHCKQVAPAALPAIHLVLRTSRCDQDPAISTLYLALPTAAHKVASTQDEQPQGMEPR